MDKCKLTLQTGKDPLAKRLAAMVNAFNSEWGIGQEIIEDYLGHNLAATNEHELVRLRGVYRSLKDDMSKPEDHFNVEEMKPPSGSTLTQPPAAEAAPGSGPDAPPAETASQPLSGGTAGPLDRSRRGAKGNAATQLFPPAAGAAPTAKVAGSSSPAPPSGGAPSKVPENAHARLKRLQNQLSLAGGKTAEYEAWEGEFFQGVPPSNYVGIAVDKILACIAKAEELLTPR